MEIDSPAYAHNLGRGSECDAGRFRRSPGWANISPVMTAKF